MLSLYGLLAQTVMYIGHDELFLFFNNSLTNSIYTVYYIKGGKIIEESLSIFNTYCINRYFNL